MDNGPSGQPPCNEEDVVSFHWTEPLDIHSGPLNQREQITLDTLCRRIPAILLLVAHNLVNFVNDNDAALLREPARRQHRDHGMSSGD